MDHMRTAVRVDVSRSCKGENAVHCESCYGWVYGNGGPHVTVGLGQSRQYAVHKHVIELALTSMDPRYIST